MPNDEEKQETAPTEEIQEVEYVPAQEVEPTYSEAANPVKEVPEVVYAKKETPKERAARISAKVGSGLSNVVKNVAAGTRAYIEKKRAQRLATEAQNPQPVRKFSRQTIQVHPQVNQPPQSPQTQRIQRQFYQNETGGMGAIINSPPRANMFAAPAQGNFMDRFGGTGSNIMARFGGKQRKGMSKGAMSPLQRMMGGMSGMGSKGSPLMKMMKGGNFGIGKKKTMRRKRRK